MAWFGQGKDTVEWEEFRDDILCHKWPANEIKKGARLIIRPGQNAIFYSNGAIEGIFKDEGNYDIVTQITPFLSTLKGVFTLRGDTGLRAEVYFVNSKELLMPWGTRQRIMIPSPQAPAGIPVGMNGNMTIEFRDYVTFIKKVAGVKATFSMGDVSERVIGVLNPIISECILSGQQQIGVNALAALQSNSRALAKSMLAELDSELSRIGLGVASLNIVSINYPKEIQEMAEKMAAQSFVGDVGKYTAVAFADSLGKDGGGGAGAQAAQMAMGFQLANQMTGAQAAGAQAAAQSAGGDKFCPKCRKMVASNFCPDCGTQTV
jgi:membrane protease subunit (stomatin/prohibitin family)